MKKLLLALALLLPLSAVAGERSFKDWLKDLDARIRQTEKKRAGALTAAASVRGDKQSDAKEIYWKGRKGQRPVTAEELDSFKAAVALAQEGKNAEAKKGLEDFTAKYPESALAPDAKEALTYLAAAPAEAAPAEAPKQ